MKFDQFIKSLKNSKPALAVLIDPDKFNPELITLASKNKVSCFLVGGSGDLKSNITTVIKKIKKLSSIPVILFPGNEKQLSKSADGLLLLSLLSGRNAEYLIEKHVKAAPIIKKLKLPFIPTAYLLIDGGKISTTQKVTHTKPISSKNTSLIKNTSIAGEQLGFKAIYLEAGSGANKSIRASTIREIKKCVSIPIIVGGGINSIETAKSLINAGVNMIVVGNALEKNKNLIIEIASVF